MSHLNNLLWAALVEQESRGLDEMRVGNWRLVHARMPDWLRPLPPEARPNALWRRFLAGEIDGYSLASAIVILQALNGPYNIPTVWLPVEHWRTMFRAAGLIRAHGTWYTLGDDATATFPRRRSARMFRGAGAAYSAGLSWTLEVSAARSFAVRQAERYPGAGHQVFTADVPAEALLGVSTGTGIGFKGHEWWVDAEHLEIEPYEAFSTSQEAFHARA